MLSIDLSLLANRLWQSTLCVGVAWLLTLALKENRAAIPYGLCLTASVKFLIPFSVLADIGARFPWRSGSPTPEPEFSGARSAEKPKKV